MNSSSITIQIRLSDLDSDKHIQEKFDIKNLNEDDVKSLRVVDPFAYYSIPGILRAHMYGQEDNIDLSNQEALCRSSSEVQSRSDPTSPRANKRSRTNTTVTRRTGISYEAHPSAILEDLIDELEALSEDVFEKALI